MYINEKTQGPPSSPSSLKMRTEKLFGSFGENFHPVLHCPDMNLLPIYYLPIYYLSNEPHRAFPNINFKNTSTKEIENIIRSLKAKESHGYDGITTKILKISTPFISSPLSYIFNKSMISGIFPTRLKYATIKPIFKNGDKKNVANYRPVLPSFSKILEKIMYIRLMSHLETNNILAAEQFGFRTTSSTEQASFNFINNILSEFKKKIMSEVSSFSYKKPSTV